jgi:hypothetical protein
MCKASYPLSICSSFFTIFASLCHVAQCFCVYLIPGLRIKETKEVYEGEVTELTPVETENPMGG